MERRAKAPEQIVLVHRLPKVTNDSVLQSAGADALIGVGRHQDRRNRVTSIDEVPVELEAGHLRHVDISDQAACFGEMRRCEEIGCRRKSLDSICQRSHEPSHGFAKELIVLDDRDQ